MEPTQSLLEIAKEINPNFIQNPVLRELVIDAQTKLVTQIADDSHYWSDTKFRQWREHSSHNPW